MTMFKTTFTRLMIIGVALAFTCTAEAKVKQLTLSEVRAQLDQMSGYHPTDVTYLCNGQVQYSNNRDWNRWLFQQCQERNYENIRRYFRNMRYVQSTNGGTVGFPSFKVNNVRRFAY
jgi:hypothetical protein